MSQPIRFKFVASLAVAGGAALFGLLATTATPVARADDKKVDFTKDIEPIFKESCIKCHHLSPDDPKHKPKGKFRLDDAAEAMKGGDSGKAIIPGNANDSLLYKLLQGPVKTGDDEIDAMPKPKKGEDWKPLPKDQIDLIKAWIDEGAPWP